MQMQTSFLRSILVAALLLARHGIAQADTGPAAPPADSASAPADPSGTESPAAGGAGLSPLSLEIWNDPTFQRQFLGSYGFQAEIEPKVSVVERQQMERLIPLLGSDPAAAAAGLIKITSPASSALFDFMLGNIRFQDNRLEEAATHYEAALGKFPSFRRAHKNLALVQVRQGSFDPAIRSLGRVIELGGGDGVTYGLLGHAYSSSSQFTSAESAYRAAVLLQPDTLDWKLGLTQSLLRQQKFAEVAALCEELIARHPARADLWLLQASARIGLGQPRKAAENYELVRRMGKANAPILHMLGDIYVNEGVWEMALRAYRQAVEIDPAQALQRPLRNVEALAQRGALAEARSLLDLVRQTWGERLDAAERRTLLRLEARLAVAEGAGGEAVQVLEQIVALDPLDGEALLLLGQHYARAGDAERAVFYYERAGGLEATEAEAKIRQAQILVGQSKYREAVPLLKRAQELKPRDDVGRYLEQVERLARARG